MLKYGVDLTSPIKKHEHVYSTDSGKLIICLDEIITKEIADEILDIINGPSDSRVVLKDTALNDEDKSNIKQILKDNNIKKVITL